MKKSLIASLVSASLLSLSSMALAAEPVQLTKAQMDNVTAGNGTGGNPTSGLLNFNIVTLTQFINAPVVAIGLASGSTVAISRNSNNAYIVQRN